MIINTGSRTDIPAYYSEWFCNRIKEGYVLVRNPYYPQQVSKYRLSPDIVDILCFCTKNPAPMLNRLEELLAFPQFWFVTITPYGKDIEPNVPDKAKVIADFQRLSQIVGTHAIGWRYDPIFITEKYSLAFHLDSFLDMAKSLCTYTEWCVISFIDLYEKTKRNFPGIKEVSKADQETLVREFVRIGKKYGISIRTCCENNDFARFGADVSGCMTQPVLEKAAGCSFLVPNKKYTTREQCCCLLGNDIGMYNTCGHGCLYCYANYDRKTVTGNMLLHDPCSPFLIGNFRDGDIVKETKQVSFRDGQLNLFDYI